jgi:hypothetical protein
MSSISKAAKLALVSLCAASCAVQSTDARAEALTVTGENDVLTNSDNNYTNGGAITWVSSDIASYDDDGFVSKWAGFWKFLPFVLDDGYSTYESWSLVQEINTPNEIRDPNPPEDDQPYSGVLYVDSLLYARKERWAHAWELKAGVVGPASQAESVQKKVHDRIGADEPLGWDTQLPNEPIVNVGYTGSYLAAAGNLGQSAEWRIVPMGSVAFGNYFTGASAGVYGEVGWNLVDAFGGTSLRSGLNAASTVGVGPVDRWSVSFFGGVAEYGVIHYLPLDGTVFHDSRSVDSKPFIGMSSFGVSARRGGLVVSLAATFFTDTFDTQRETADFGTLSMSWYF